MESYLSAEMQLVYSAVPADWALCKIYLANILTKSLAVGGRFSLDVLLICIDPSFCELVTHRVFSATTGFKFYKTCKNATKQW